MVHVKCLAHRKPSLSACCHALPPLPGSCPLNILHAVCPQPPHQPQKSIHLNLVEEGQKGGGEQPFCGPVMQQAAFTCLYMVPLNLDVCLPSPCPAASCRAVNVHLFHCLICSVPHSHPLAALSTTLLCRSHRSQKLLSLEFQGACP